MTARWLFTTEGVSPYYQDGDYVYLKAGDCAFSVSDGWWYSIKDGKAAYYVAEQWVYFPNGKPAFYFA